MSHNDVPPEFLQNNANWNALIISRKGVRFNIQIFITEWISGDLATGKK